MMIRIKETDEFTTWLNSLTLKEQTQVDARLTRIKKFMHFGDVKGISPGLAELRWKNGWRVYFTRETKFIVLLLSGGHKNDQKKDIEKAKILLQRYDRNQG